VVALLNEQGCHAFSRLYHHMALWWTAGKGSQPLSFFFNCKSVSCQVRLPPARGLLRPVCQEAEPDRKEGVAADEAEKLVGLDCGVAVGVVQGEGRLHLVRVAVGRGRGLGLGFLCWGLGF